MIIVLIQIIPCWLALFMLISFFNEYISSVNWTAVSYTGKMRTKHFLLSLVVVIISLLFEFCAQFKSVLYIQAKCVNNILMLRF